MGPGAHPAPQRATHRQGNEPMQQELCCFLAREKSLEPRAVCFVAEPVTVSAAVTNPCRLPPALELLCKMMLCVGSKGVLRAKIKVQQQWRMTFPIHLTKVFAEACWKCVADLKDPERLGNTVLEVSCC